MEKIEFIEEYIRTDKSSDYQWNDNHGVLIRCKDCKYWQDNNCRECPYYDKDFFKKQDAECR